LHSLQLGFSEIDGALSSVCLFDWEGMDSYELASTPRLDWCEGEVSAEDGDGFRVGIE